MSTRHHFYSTKFNFMTNSFLGEQEALIFWTDDFCMQYPFVRQPRYRSIHWEWNCHKSSHLDDFSLNRHLVQKWVTFKMSVESKVIQLGHLFTNAVKFVPIPKWRGQLLKSIFSIHVQTRWQLFQQMAVVWIVEFSNLSPSQMALPWKTQKLSLYPKN